MGCEQVRGRSNSVLGRSYRVPNLITAISRRLCVPNISNYSGVPRMTNHRSLDVERGCGETTLAVSRFDC